MKASTGQEKMDAVVKELYKIAEDPQGDCLHNNVVHLVFLSFSFFLPLTAGF